VGATPASFATIGNTTLSISVNGGKPQTITFDKSVFDAASAAAFINQHLIGAVASVVLVNGNGQLRITSNTAPNTFAILPEPVVQQ
jgi:hypothetical protein